MDTPKPFELEYPPQFAELLHKLNISLALSTYQAGKVVLISAFDNDHLIQLPRTFENAMGMAIKDEKLAVATGKNVEILKNSSDLAKIYPPKPNTYDSMYMPRATYHTGYLALHDMAFLKDKLVVVNTLFSCLSHIDKNQSFTPFWQPPFISDYAPEDRCHLNGIAIEDDEIKYVTALGTTDTAQGWRDNKIKGGVLMEYPSGKILVDGLSMPHSPRLYNGKLYVLNSAQGELIEVNPETGTYEVVVNLGGFARGMDIYGDYLFIGVSKLRHNSQVFRDLPIAETSFAGVIAVYLPYKTIVGQVKYKMSVDEIYDVKVLAQKTRPNILSTDMEVNKGAIIFNEKFYWGEVKSENEAKNTQKSQNTPQQGSIRVQVLKNIRPTQIYEQFSNMVCKDLKNDLANKNINSSLNLIVATMGNTPLGLVVFEAKKDKTAKIHSVFVKNEFRNKKLATNLLKHLHQILQQNQIEYVEANFTSKNVDEEITKKLFAKFSNVNLIIE